MQTKGELGLSPAWSSAWPLILPWRICIRATVPSKSPYSYDDRGGQLFSCPLPSAPFTAFWLPSPTTPQPTLPCTETLKPEQCLTSREQWLLGTSDDFIHRNVTAGFKWQICLWAVLSWPFLSSCLVSPKTNGLFPSLNYFQQTHLDRFDRASPRGGGLMWGNTNIYKYIYIGFPDLQISFKSTKYTT